jgi:hypothetical protein
VLFLLRPRQTWMPYALPRSREQQDVYNEQLQKGYTSTRRVAPPPAAAPPRTLVAELKELAQLRENGVLTDAEFALAKEKLLAPEEDAS